MAQLQTGLLGCSERPWRRAPDNVSPGNDIYRSTAEERAQAVQAALERNITFFHADHEREAVSLGVSIKTLGARENVILSTTDGDALSRCPDTEAGAYEAIGRAVTRKLELLGTDTLDVFHLYDIRADVHTPARLAGAMRAMMDARSQELISYLGATCYDDYNYLAQVIATGDFAPEYVVARFNFLDQRASLSLLPTCAERGITALAAQTFAWLGGVSFVRFPNTWRLRNMTQNFTGRSAAGAHLRWILGQPGIGGVLVSMQEPAQVRENADSVQSAMPRADMASVFASFVEAIQGTDEGWQALLKDPEWEVRMAAEAYLETQREYDT